MRKILCLAVCFLLFAGATAHAADGGVVAFDLQKVAAESDALKVAIDALEKKYGPQKDELEKERQAIERKTADYARTAPTAKQKKEFEDQRKKYGEQAQAFMRLFQADEMRVRTDIDTLIYAAAKGLAERKGYGMLIDIAAVPYLDPKLDVTNDMLTEINALWKKMNADAAKTQTAPADK